MPSAKSVLRGGRWVLAGLVAVSLLSVLWGRFTTEVALPPLRADAVEAAGSEGTASELYARTLDSLRFRLSERHRLLAEEPESPAIEHLSGQIESWQDRMDRVVRYRGMAGDIATYRLYSNLAIVLLSLLLLVLFLGPRFKRALTG